MSTIQTVDASQMDPTLAQMQAGPADVDVRINYAERAKARLELFTEVAEQEGFTYENNENGQLSRANSAHDVHFGVLTDSQGQPQRVAIKTFEGIGTRSINRARTEQRNFAKAAKRGFQTLEPYEQPIFSTPRQDGGEGEVVFLITKQRDELKAMNGLSWQVDPGDEGFDDMTILLEEIADFTAEIHAAGIVHNDWQLKNVVMTSQGDFVLVDMEKAMIHREGLSLKTDPKQPLRDIRTLFVSLLDNGFMPNSPQRLVYDHLEKHFIDKYLESLRTYTTGKGEADPERRARHLQEIEKTIIAGISEVEEKRAVRPLEQPRPEAVARYAGLAIAELAGISVDQVPTSIN